MSDTINVESLKGKVDFAVITIRQDEYKAVLDRVTNRKVVLQGRWLYEYGTIETVNKETSQHCDRENTRARSWTSTATR